MPRVSVNGADLYFEERGSGPPILLIHGLGGDADVWGASVEELADDHRVLAYDRRGHTRSGQVPLADFRRNGEDAAALLRALDAVPATVVGWSGGGKPRNHFCAGRSATGPAGPGMTGSRTRCGEALLSNGTAAMAELDIGTGEHLSEEQIGAIACPAVVLVGELSDPLFARVSERTGRLLPHGGIERIPGAGHVIHLERPAEFVRAVREASQPLRSRSGGG